jgi:anti-sigma regulatory factor (Ser/Thr protein kinase)
MADSAVVPYDAASAAAARSVLRHALTRRGVPSATREDAVLVLSELVGNSVRHARPRSDGTLLIRWQLDADHLLLEVTDGGSVTEPRRASMALEASGGRGLNIVEVLAAGWGARNDADGATVWARLPLQSGARRGGAARPRQVDEPPDRKGSFRDGGQQLVG